jgi:hypothetical protein
MSDDVQGAEFTANFQQLQHPVQPITFIESGAVHV